MPVALANFRFHRWDLQRQAAALDTGISATDRLRAGGDVAINYRGTETSWPLQNEHFEHKYEMRKYIRRRFSLVEFEA